MPTQTDQAPPQRPDLRPGPSPSPWRRLDQVAPRWAVVVVIVAASIGTAGAAIHAPYHSIAPGPALDVLDEIDVRGAKTFPSEGKLLLLTASVSEGELNLWDVVYAWLDPNVEMIPHSSLVPPGSSQEDENLVNRIDIEESKIVAAVAAFRALGYTVRQNGVRILDVVPGSPADGELRSGDLITRVDGTRVRTRRALVDLIDAREPGDPISLRVRRRGSARDITFDTGRAEDGSPRLGVTLLPSYALPVPVTIDSRNIVGPSGGLVFALTVADVFSKRDLTAGRTIGVTGTISLDPKTGEGVVGLIGAVAEKVRGAARAGATIFVVPQDEAAEARAVAPATMRVIGVRTLADAVKALRALSREGGSAG